MGINEVLIVLQNFVLLVLFITLVILGIQVIILVSKLNKISDDASKKLESLDSLFNIVDTITSTVFKATGTITTKLVDIVNKRIKDEEE